MKGADYAWFSPSDAWFNANGIQFVSRYLAWLPNGKVLSASEYNHLRSLGIQVCLNWEYDAQDQKRGHAGGVADATEAYRQVKAMGIPEPFVIYFSADWDASEADFNNYIKPYLQGAASVLGGAQYVGVYGSYYTVKRAFDAGLVKYGWQSYAWSGGQWDSRAQVRQVQNGLGSGAWDLDYSYATDFGQVGAQTVVPDPIPDPPPPVVLPGENSAMVTFTLDGSLNVVHVDNDGNLVTNYFFTDNKWYRLTIDTGYVPNGLVTATTFVGQQHVFAEKANGKLGHGYYYGSAWHHEDL